VIGGWRRRRALAETSTQAEVDAAADLLAARTLDTWSQQMVQRGIGAPAPVRVRWRWAVEDVALPRQDVAASLSLATDPDTAPSADELPGTAQMLDSGLVTRLHDDVYARLRHGRLVLIGGPGAGKTGAMILLLVEALHHRERMPDTDRATVPVPVWLTAGSWDPRGQGLRDWVMTTLNRDHPYLGARDFGPDAVAQLFDTGCIAVFLDGLDEMPDPLRAEALHRLTAEAPGRRMVITSRPAEFRDALVDTGRQLPHTAVVELQPVDPQAAARYLLKGQPGPTRKAWQDVADQLLTNPDGVLAGTLTTPLTLSLARSAYKQENPRELITGELADEGALRTHLLDQVLLTAYPDPSERTHATYWLSWCAHQMNQPSNGPTRDLRWWQIPSWIPRSQVGLAAALIAGLAVTAMVGLVAGLLELLSPFSYESISWHDMVGGLLVGPVFGLFGGLVVGLVTGLGVQAVVPRSIAIRWPKLHDMGSVVSMVSDAGLVGGLGFGIVGIAFGIGGVASSVADQELRLVDLLWALLFPFLVLLGVFVVGLLVGVPTGLINVWRVPLASVSAVTPLLVYRRDVRSQWVGGLMSGLACALLLVAVMALIYRDNLMVWLRFAGVYGLILGLMVGLVSGLLGGSRAAASPSLLFTEVALRLRRQRVRFMPLLENALGRQVLRQAGAVYQFRHADLQDRLADRYQTELGRHRDT
jgi:MFS family permease